MHQLPQTAFVGAKRIDRIEPDQSQAAQHAVALIVEWCAIDEWSFARPAEVFGSERLRFSEARRADRHAAKIFKRFAADTAVVGENQIEDASGSSEKKRAKG